MQSPEVHAYGYLTYGPYREEASSWVCVACLDSDDLKVKMLTCDGKLRRQSLFVLTVKDDGSASRFRGFSLTLRKDELLFLHMVLSSRIDAVMTLEKYRQGEIQVQARSDQAFVIVSEGRFRQRIMMGEPEIRQLIGARDFMALVGTDFQSFSPAQLWTGLRAASSLGQKHHLMDVLELDNGSSDVVEPVDPDVIRGLEMYMQYRC